MHAKEAEVALKFPIVAPEEKITKMAVLKTLTDQITTTFLHRIACFL